MNEQQKPAVKKDRFAAFKHLKRLSHVTKKGSSKQLIVLVVAALLCVLIVWLMVSGGSHKVVAPVVAHSMVNNDEAIQANIRKLRRMEATHPSRITPRVPGITTGLGNMMPNANTKKIAARRAAPTVMFSLSHSNSGVTSAATKTGSSVGNKVLAGRDAFSSFLNGQSQGADSVSATHLQHPGSTILAGEFIHATLETAINSDLPGMVRAVVNDPVYAYQGETPLIPAGSRLIGQYATQASNGSASTRVFVVWNRVITPNGVSVQLNSTSTDALGRAGVGADAVDHHFAAIFGTASLLSVLGASTATYGVSGAEQPNSADQYRQAISGAFQQSAQSTLQHNLSIKPTIHVHQGDSINVFVARDLDFYAAQHGAGE